MSVLSLVLVGLSLSMDAFAIAVSNGISCQDHPHKLRQALIIALAFGGAQAIMPLLGYLAGSSFEGFISAIDHWIAFGLLGIIGGKMVVEGVQALRQPEAPAACIVLTPRLLLVQAIATSIDALAVGISFAVIRVNIGLAAALIGCTTFLCCLLGYGLGRYFGRYLKDAAVIVGGLVLIGIGLKILLEHTGIL